MRSVVFMFFGLFPFPSSIVPYPVDPENPQKAKNPLFVGGGLSYRLVKELTVDSGCS
jgi:hypothetical protein